MPNLDGGHYFLTALVPIDNSGTIEHDGFKSSPVHMVRDALEALPTALQSVATEEIGLQSFFARSPRTHLARFVVIDAPFFNGRDPTDSLVTALRGTDLLAPQPVDQLACPYLLFAADFDPQGDEPRHYLEELWALSEPELRSVFQFCYGFDGVQDPASFATFVIECQVETTMPFNDYWTTLPPFRSLETWTLLVAPVAALILAFAVGVATRSLGVGIISSLVFLSAAIYGDYQMVMKVGAKPLPTAPDSSLQHVLKALYLQQAFAGFAINHQTARPAVLKADFTEFVRRHDPSNLVCPTQPPGVIRATFDEAADA